MVGTHKIGLGIVTCDRPDYLLQSVRSVIDNCRDIDVINVVNDGKQLSSELSSKIISMSFMRVAEFYTHEHEEPYQNVAVGKNDIIEKLLDRGCDYIFIMEDDMLLKTPDVFEKYIQAMEKSGIKHMNFAKHGLANAVNGVITPKETVNYGDFKLGFYPNLVGSFSVFHKDVLNDIGSLDTEYHNAFEHVDHTYMICKAEKYHPPFWHFADLLDSEEYVTEIEGSIENTTRIDPSQNEIDGYKRFTNKHGIIINRVPRATREELITSLKKLKNG